MRGRYLIRNPRSAGIITAVDTVLALVHPNRSPPVVPSQPRRILVADWAHLGNVLLAMPALRLLRARFPGAEIGFLTGSWSRHVLEGTGLCDHVHLVDHFILSRLNGGRLGKIRRYLKMRRRAVTEMRALGYDVAIDLGCHFPPAAPLFYAAGIRARAGFTCGGFGPLLTHPVRWLHTSRPVSDYPRDLLRALWPGQTLAPDALTPCYPGQPRVPLPRELITEPYIVLHMGSGAPTREWSEEHWTTVATALAAEGPRLVLAGTGPREGARLRRVAAGLPVGKAAILLDRPWPEYVAVVAHAAHVICLESSSAHIAAAFSVPTTAIYAGLNNLVQWGPCNPNALVLTAPVGCAPCYRRVGCEAMACIRGVAPELVIASVRAALSGAGSPR
ncbi:MAG: glycosyltransferase family 9 protein [Stellaceae bacterium]